jgi:uncharacterized glyoxalase superfamily protein PhnB
MTDNPSGSPNGTESAQQALLVAKSLMAALTVSDVQKSLDWYRDALGFGVDQVYGPPGTMRAVSLKAGDVRILLNQDNGAKGLDRVKGEGFSLQITTGQDVDEIAARIRRHGTTLESDPADMPWGARAFRVCDPDGFRLTISTERPR